MTLKLKGNPTSLKHKVVVGVDEAGRGAWAGPVVAAAVQWPNRTQDQDINDSKQLTPMQREQLFLVVEDKAEAVGIGVASCLEVDQWGVGQATRIAMQRAVDNLGIEVDLVMVDGYKVNFDGVESVGVIKGDSKYLSIAAASIIAKVTRDRMLVSLHNQYPRYGFAIHKGYGTKLHQERLDKYGASREHRRSFAPIKKLLDEGKILQDELVESSNQS